MLRASRLGVRLDRLLRPQIPSLLLRLCY